MNHSVLGANRTIRSGFATAAFVVAAVAVVLGLTAKTVGHAFFRAKSENTVVNIKSSVNYVVPDVVVNH
jgi:hypothetical protein